MPAPLSSDDAEQPPADWARMLRRGVRRRCPRCGGGQLFRTWWSIRDRCPRCGLLFAREPGYFTGVYLVNFGLVLAVLFVEVMGFAVLLANRPDAPVLPPLLLGLVIAVAMPVIFYPFARTTWSALDLAMTPMELDEILDAVVAADEAEGDADRPAGDVDPLAPPSGGRSTEPPDGRRRGPGPGPAPPSAP